LCPFFCGGVLSWLPTLPPRRPVFYGIKAGPVNRHLPPEYGTQLAFLTTPSRTSLRNGVIPTEAKRSGGISLQEPTARSAPRVGAFSEGAEERFLGSVHRTADFARNDPGPRVSWRAVGEKCGLARISHNTESDKPQEWCHSDRSEAKWRNLSLRAQGTICATGGRVLRGSGREIPRLRPPYGGLRSE